MGIDALFGDLQIRAMAQDPLDHRRDLRGGAGLELRIDTGGLLLDMPVDHDPFATIADVPFGHEILMPRAKLLRVGGAGRGSLTPDRGAAHTEDRVRHGGDGDA